MADEQDEQGKPKEQKRTIILDPSKFTINVDGEVIVTDPDFVEALRVASLDEGIQEHGVGIGVIFGL